MSKPTNAHIPEEVGLPLFDQVEGASAPAPFPQKNPFDALVDQCKGVGYSPDPIREVIKASPLTVEQADALRRGEPLPKVRLRDPQVRGTVEEPRLSNQCRAILDRLKQGQASNKELAAIALNYRARISDLRGAGFEIELAEYHDESGKGFYELKEAKR